MLCGLLVKIFSRSFLMDSGWTGNLLRICLKLTDKLQTGNCISYWVGSWWGRNDFMEELSRPVGTGRKIISTGQILVLAGRC